MRRALLAAVLLAGCYGGASFEVHDQTLTDRTRLAVRVAAGVWGGLAGSVESVTFVDGEVKCPGAPSGHYDGCQNDGHITVTNNAACPEATALAHEVGHAVLGGDADHEDPRWCRYAFWDSMRTALQALVPGDEACLSAIAQRMYDEPVSHVTTCHR